MNKINWAQANWHVWSNSILSYPPPDGCDYYPHEGFTYQYNLRNHDRFSMLNEIEVNQLVKSVHSTVDDYPRLLAAAS